VRLAKLINGLSYSGSIHETLESSVISQGKSIAKLDSVIHHYGKLLTDRIEYKNQYYFILAQREAEKNPNDKWAQHNLMQQALAAGKWEIAFGAAHASMKLEHYDKPIIVYGAGLALQELGRHKEAIEYFNALLGGDAKHVMAMLRKGLSHKELGNVNIARQLMIDAIELAPTYVPAYSCLAELELSVNNFDAARRTIMDALKFAANEPVLYNLLIKIEMARNNQRQAARDAILGLQNCPNENSSLWHRLAAVYFLETGEREAAKSVFKAGLQAFPDDPGLDRLKKIFSM